MIENELGHQTHHKLAVLFLLCAWLVRLQFLASSTLSEYASVSSIQQVPSLRGDKDGDPLVSLEYCFEPGRGSQCYCFMLLFCTLGVATATATVLGCWCLNFLKAQRHSTETEAQLQSLGT